MKNSILISFIVPSFNRSRSIIRCLESISQQFFSDFECLIVDGNSDDNSVDIISDYCKKDERFKLIRNTKTHVTPDNVCLGMQNAKGKYIAFVDSDDTVEPKFVKTLYNNLIKYDCDISQVAFIGNNTNEIKVYKSNHFKKVQSNILKYSKQYSRCLRMFKREYIDNILKYYSQYHDIIWEDSIFTFALFLSAKSFVIQDIGLYKYYFERNNDCPKRIYNKDYFIRLEKSHNINLNIFSDFNKNNWQAYNVPIVPIYEAYRESDNKKEFIKNIRKNKFMNKCIKKYKWKKGSTASVYFIFKTMYVLHLPMWRFI